MNKPIEIEMNDVIIKVVVTYWEKYVPAQTYGDPYYCYDAEGGYGEYKIIDAVDYEGNKVDVDSITISNNDEEHIQTTLFEIMEDDVNYIDPDMYRD